MATLIKLILVKFWEEIRHDDKRLLMSKILMPERERERERERVESVHKYFVILKVVWSGLVWFDCFNANK